jgi:hypothetical protein
LVRFLPVVWYAALAAPIQKRKHCQVFKSYARVGTVFVLWTTQRGFLTPRHAFSGEVGTGSP